MPGTSFFHQARNNAWSNHRLYGVCQKLTDQELDTKRTPFSSSILQTLNHILTNDWYYLDALVDGGRGRGCFADEMPFAAIDKLAAAQRDTDMRLMAFCEQLNDKDAIRSVELVREDASKTHDTVGDILSHLFVYQTHQRGQVHALLAVTSQASPPLDDYHLEYDTPFPGIDFSALGRKGA
ncbi:MAG TPA: damage-inducible protein DinB [Thalassospira sp.]|nr:damage-inducible protein DinB [Thalassospira sp.]|tara:strand:- start:299 stop:841 length:543 start_codon:yes stop_codon:yes gene_type:complete